MSYALWHQPAYGAGLRSPDRYYPRHATTRPPRRRRSRRRLGSTVSALLAGLAGRGATDALAAPGPRATASTAVERA